MKIYALILFITSHFWTSCALKNNYLLASPNIYRVGTPFAFSFFHSVPDFQSLKFTISTIRKGESYVDISDDFVSNSVLLKEKLYFFSTKGIQLPPSAKVDLSGEYSLNVELVTSTTTYKNSSSIKISTIDRVLLVQTDKSIYKPSQTVRVRVFALKPDLTPTYDKINANVFDSAKNRIFQIRNLQDAQSGVVEFEIPLSDQPVLGNYSIETFTDKNDVKSNVYFLVDKYVLPKFSVNVIPPDYVLRSQPYFAVSVEPRYTFGKPVRGVLRFSVSPQTNYLYFGKTMKMTSSDGKSFTVDEFDSDRHTFNINVAELFRNFGFGVGDQYVKIYAEMEEAFTGIKSNNSVMLKISQEEFTVQFSDATPKYFREGMPVSASVIVKRADGTPPAANNGLKFSLKLSYQNLNKKTQLYEFVQNYIMPPSPLDASGVVSLRFNAPSGTSSFTLYATYGTISANQVLTKFSTSSTSLNVRVSFDESSTSSSVDGLDSEDRSFVITSTQKVSVRLMLLSRGQLISVKEVEASSMLPTATSADGFSTFSTVIRVENLVELYSPKLRLVALVVDRVNGEVVADSLEIDVPHLRNKVSITPSSERVTVGSNLTLNVKASPNSYVAFVGVDQSVLLLNAANDITKNAVIEALQVFDGASSQGNWPSWRVPMMMIDRRKRRSVIWPWWNNGADTAQLLQEAGVLVITDGFYRQTPRIEVMYAMDFQAALPFAKAAVMSTTTSQTEKQTRTEFPEVWIWKNSTVGSDGNLVMPNIRVPDTITSWIISAVALHPKDGLGVADVTKIVAFKQFFVSLNLPYELRLGESFVLQALVFNYLGNDVTATVTFPLNENYKIGAMNDVNADPAFRTLSFPVSVRSNQNALAAVVITPTKLGNIQIFVKAEVENRAGDAVSRVILVSPPGIPMERVNTQLLNLGNAMETIRVDFPPSDLRVAGSERVEVRVIGDVLGPALQNLDMLLLIPTGCGEQNMLGFAPNIYVLQYLRAVGRDDAMLDAKARKNMLIGYQNELTYRRSDGSFSAFGNSDQAGSTWLTAFVLKCFAQSSRFEIVEMSAVIGQSLTFLLNTQAKDGKFEEPPLSRVCHKSMQGGASEGIPLTAYVTISLLEVLKMIGTKDVERSKQVGSVVDKAIAHLETVVEDGRAVGKAYFLALIFYAFEFAKQQGRPVNILRRDEVVQQLLKLQISSAGNIYWNAVSPDSNEPTHSNRFYYEVASAGDVELASYVLLAANLYKKDVSWSLGIMRWLSRQQNPRGGFGSTQDTVIGLEAIAAFGQQLSTSQRADGTVRFQPIDENQKNIFDEKVFPLNDGNSLLLQNQVVEQGGTRCHSIRLSSTGSGMCVAQVVWTYNVNLPVLNQWNSANGLQLKVAYILLNPQSTFLTMKVCAKVDAGRDGNEMSLLEISMPGGFEPSDSMADLLARYSKNGLKLSETVREKITLYLDYLTSQEMCFELNADRKSNVLNSKPKEIKLSNYYQSDAVNFVQYQVPALSELKPCQVCDTCPGCSPYSISSTPAAPRISHTCVLLSVLVGLMWSVAQVF